MNRRVLLCLLLTLVCLSGCRAPVSQPQVVRTPLSTPTPELTPPSGPEPPASPLKIVLRDGSPPQQKTPPDKKVEGRSLHRAETERLLKKFGTQLPRAEKQEFSNLPPPRTSWVLMTALPGPHHRDCPSWALMTAPPGPHRRDCPSWALMTAPPGPRHRAFPYPMPCGSRHRTPVAPGISRRAGGHALRLLSNDGASDGTTR